MQNSKYNLHSRQLDNSQAIPDFSAFYSENAPTLIAFVRKNIFDIEDCEEIVQDIFESVWTRWGELQHMQSLRAYLYSMARNKIVDYIRHSQVKKKYEEHYILFEAVYESDEKAFSDETVEIESVIEKTIAKLPSRCQAAFRLRLQENLSYKEIALQMNISARTVEKHISYALEHLRKAYRRSFKTA